MSRLTRRALLTASAIPPSNQFQMRVAVNDWTPPPGSWMAGFGPNPRPNDGGVARRLRVHAVSIIDYVGTRIELVRADVAGFARPVYLRIRDRLLADGLIQRPERFLINISHTHSAPITGDKPPAEITLCISNEEAESVGPVTDGFIETVVRTVREAVFGSSTGVTLHYAQGGAFIAFNREGLPVVPPEASVVVARRTSNGVPLAVLFGHACHPVCRTDHALDSDHCGYAAEVIEQRLGVPALFFQGACGDLDPIARFGNEPAIFDMGGQLADAVVAMVNNNAFLPLSGPIIARLEEIHLPYSVDLTDPGELAELRDAYQDRAENFDTGISLEGQAQRHAVRMVDMINTGRLPPDLPMTVQHICLDPLRIIAMAHEVVSGRQAFNRNRFPNPVWTMAYTNYVEAYVPGDDLLWQGDNYAAGWNTDTGNRITGVTRSGIAYLMPAPLLASPVGVSPATPGSAEGILTAAIDRLLS